MYELGVLELLFPEFGSIKAQVVWDFYHRYTVDEHTLLAIKNVELLTSSDGEDDGRFKTLLADTVDPSILTLALLFHDVGKGRDEQHSEQGARMAARALRRFRFRSEEIDTIAFLIQHHLAMAAVIFRRDLDDDQVVARFADLVEDPEILRLLTLLTYADIKAVAPGTLNEWKRDLLWQLYLAAHRKLTLGYGEERIEEQEVGDRISSVLGAELDKADFERFIEGFPARYLRNTPPKEIYEHYRMAQRLDDHHPIQTRIIKKKEYYELCVVTPDHSYLFAKIVGLLSYFEMNILRGHGFSNRQELILDFFGFIDAGGQFRRIHERTRFQELLDKSIFGEISVEKLLQGKEESVLFRRTVPRFEPSIYFEDEHSDRFTIVEIVAPDALGLLYRISREISRLGCDIELALISTEGERAVDVFYLGHQGSKLSAQLKKDLSDRILQAIS
jgi:[protein-PII] uridylyltransferase